MSEQPLQSTSKILMVRPASFAMNEQTAVNNYFQKSVVAPMDINEQARREFDGMVDLLRFAGVDVFVVDDTADPPKPDSVFPNNWISFHENHQRVLYPMFAPNRRTERRKDLDLPDDRKARYKDYTIAEESGLYLEGTGSLVLDRAQRLAFAALSPRTHKAMVEVWCEELDYEPIMFHAHHTVNGRRVPVYHTNVVLSLGSMFAVIADKCIEDGLEREKVKRTLLYTGRQLITVSEEQAANFACNILEVNSADEKRFIIMSDTAYNAFTEEQRKLLSLFGKILHAPLNCIETFGGGSARCMIAEIF